MAVVCENILRYFHMVQITRLICFATFMNLSWVDSVNNREINDERWKLMCASFIWANSSDISSVNDALNIVPFITDSGALFQNMFHIYSSFLWSLISSAKNDAYFLLNFCLQVRNTFETLFSLHLHTINILPVKRNNDVDFSMMIVTIRNLTYF